jgi:hypothetical protein
MGELLLETLLYIIFGIIQFLFILPGELAVGMANGWKVPLFNERRGWARKSLAVLISFCFWSIVGLLIYFLTLIMAS